MKKIFLISSIIFFFSCESKKEEAVAVKPNEVKSVVSEVETSTSFARYRKGSSMLDAIYFEIIKDDKELLALDEKIKELNENENKLIRDKKEALSKANQYFADVNLEIKGITDSLLKKEIKNAIRSSEEKNSKSNTELETFEKQFENNSLKIDEAYTAFKIKKTLPEIEKYQNQNPLKLDDLYKLITEQNQLLEKIKKLK